jgi:predicted TIM-barrel fold metal-dependent hydrolase
MIIDVNAALGHYPFRQLRYNTPEKLVGLMDRNGLDRAVVTSLHALFYRDAHRGNEELQEAARAHPARLVPVPTLNPKYVGWERDLAQAVERWRAKAVALAPAYHGYALGDEAGRAVLSRISSYGVPVLLHQRFEDRRGRHAWDRAEDLTAAALLDAAKAHPKLRFLLVNWIGLDGAKLAAAGLKGRCLIDFARLQVAYKKDVPKLVQALGVESLAFGSHMPFEYVGSSLVKWANLESWPAADREKVAWRNAAAFLGL